MITQHGIPVRNVYYLLAYAWDDAIPGAESDTRVTQCPDVLSLLARLLAIGVERLAKRGIDRGYLEHRDETSRLRGRMELLESYRRLTHVSCRMVCQFDELTDDTLPNQIINTTCSRLLQHSAEFDSDTRRELNRARDLLRDVSSIRLSGRVFQRVQLHRNIRHYRLLLELCKMLHQLYLPQEKAGQSRFRDLLNGETVMNRVFEKFVLNFARRHLPGAEVRAMPIGWVGQWGNEVNRVLPSMRTDVTIEKGSSKTILDCKFYRQALVQNFGKERLHSENLYQLMAYLQNKAHHIGWEQTRGVLLYPAVDHHLDLRFELLGHPVEIQSLDLDQSWMSIHNRLLEITRRS